MPKKGIKPGELIQTKVCRWRERQLSGELGLKVYTGLQIHVDDRDVLVCHLSHGLRVLPMITKKNPSKFEFVNCEYNSVAVSETFAKTVKKALLADEKFQRKLDEFQRLLVRSMAVKKL